MRAELTQPLWHGARLTLRPIAEAITIFSNWEWNIFFSTDSVINHKKNIKQDPFIAS